MTHFSITNIIILFIGIALIISELYICYKSYTKSDLNESIERGIKDSEEGRTIPHKEAKKMFKKWLKK